MGTDYILRKKILKITNTLSQRSIIKKDKLILFVLLENIALFRKSVRTMYSENVQYYKLHAF